VKFPAGSYSTYVFPGSAIHPSQLYLAGAGFLLFGVLLLLDRKPRFDGYLFWTAVALDSILRFGIDFTRYYDSTSYLGTLGGLSFNINQLLSAGLLVSSAIMLRVLSRRPAASQAPRDGQSVEQGAGPASAAGPGAENLMRAQGPNPGAVEPRSTL
jgi:prolipoprotein diacylglyceryltransferase